MPIFFRPFLYFFYPTLLTGFVIKYDLLLTDFFLAHYVQTC